MQISAKARAEIILLRKTAFLCESCGCVYARFSDETLVGVEFRLFAAAVEQVGNVALLADALEAQQLKAFPG